MTTPEQIGRSVLGPAFCLYVREAIEAARRLEVERVFFLAREGFLIEKLWCLFGGPPGRYLHVSRRATALASLCRLGPTEIARLRWSAGELDRTALLRSYDLPDEPGATLESLVRDQRFQARVAASAAAARGRLGRYLAQVGLLGAGRVALLDVGWSGTIQDHLERALESEARAPELHGIYLGLFSAGERKRGILYDPRLPGAATLRARAPLHFVQLFEQAARAPEGMTVGYDDQGAPLLATGDPPSPIIIALQQGILDCAQNFAGAEVEAVRRSLERFIFLPTAGERDALRTLTHSDEWGRAHRGPVLSGGGGPSALFRPRRFVGEFYASYWKPGYLADTAGPLACRAFWAWERYKAWREAKRRA